MDRAEVLRLLEEHRPEWERFDVRSLAVFGSVARGEARPGSDVDVLVEFGSTVTFDNFMGLKIYLEDLLGTRVDLGTPDDLRPQLRRSVEREMLRVA